MLIENKLLLFGGKGGTGKTVCACATGIYAASKNKKTLVLSTDPAHSLGDSFQAEIGNRITRINENLDALEIDAGRLLEEYKEKHGGILKQIAEEGTFFAKEDIQKFFDLSLPGMDELMALIKVIEKLKRYFKLEDEDLNLNLGPLVLREEIEEGKVSVVEILDRLLSKGVVVKGDVVISVAEVDLISLNLGLLLSSIDKAYEFYGRKIDTRGLEEEVNRLREENERLKNSK